MRDSLTSKAIVLIQGSIIFVHGLRGHPVETWESSRKVGNDLVVGPSNLRQNIRSLFKSMTSPLESGSTQNDASVAPQKIFWPKDFLTQDIRQARVWTYGYNANVIGGLFQADNKNSVSAHGRDLKVRLEREIENEVTLYGLSGQNAWTDNGTRIRSYLWPTVSAVSLSKMYDNGVILKV